MAYTELPNSSFMDLTSWRSSGTGPIGGPAVTGFTLNVALLLDRANDLLVQLDFTNSAGHGWLMSG